MENVFNALPHVNTIWVTEDGKFHLHPHNGGKQIDREVKHFDNSVQQEPPKRGRKPKVNEE